MNNLRIDQVFRPETATLRVLPDILLAIDEGDFAVLALSDLHV
jgi:hypothetical protein